MIGIEKAVMADHQNTVLGHAGVELEGGDPDPHRRREGCQRILRREPASAPMPLKVE